MASTLPSGVPLPGFAARLRRAGLRRVAWHIAGLVAAALLAWLIVHGYRQPELIFDFANMRLC